MFDFATIVSCEKYLTLSYFILSYQFLSEAEVISTSFFYRKRTTLKFLSILVPATFQGILATVIAIRFLTSSLMGNDRSPESQQVKLF